MLKKSIHVFLISIYSFVLGSEINVRHYGYNAHGKGVIKRDVFCSLDKFNGTAVDFIKSCDNKKIVTCECSKLVREYCDSMYKEHKSIGILYSNCIVLYHFSEEKMTNATLVYVRN